VFFFFLDSFSRRVSTTPPVHPQRHDDDEGTGRPAPPHTSSPSPPSTATATVAAATAEARDATCLEPLVIFLFISFLITLMFILGPLNASKRRQR
jgi:hypothetical protein